MDGDLISRKAMLEFAHNHINGTVDCNDIARFPVVDAEPVRHGRWIQVITVPSYHYCSYCKSTHKMTMSCNKYVLLKFCPNCGAKMEL